MIVVAILCGRDASPEPSDPQVGRLLSLVARLLDVNGLFAVDLVVEIARSLLHPEALRRLMFIQSLRDLDLCPSFPPAFRLVMLDDFVGL